MVFILSAAVLAAALAFIYPTRTALPKRVSGRQPAVMLWAWERPVDLRFIDIEKFGVAFLAKSISLKSDEVMVRPRLQPLTLPEGTTVVAVARIETSRDSRPTLSDIQRQKLTQEIKGMSLLPNVSELQIDFDATQSERAFYRELIADVRRELSPRKRLSITALASWCMSDDWLSDLPIDEAVPMLFRMAGDGRQIANRLDAGDDFKAKPCRQSYGISLDEARPRLLPYRKLYVFNPDAWTEESVRKIPEFIQ